VADTKSGTRAGFSTAKSPVLAEVLYDYFLSSIKLTHATVASGVFGNQNPLLNLPDNLTVNFYLGIAHSLNQCFHYFDKYENLANLLNAYMKLKRKRDKDKQDYLVIIDALLELKPAVDDFFNNVRVLDDDVAIFRVNIFKYISNALVSFNQTF
jgi:hypothetical protein